MEEEQIVSPLRTVVRTFRANRLSFGALILFLIIALSVFILPVIYPVDLSYTESTQQNLPPSFNFMSLPKVMQKNPRAISVGSCFSAGVSEAGDIYVWGTTKSFAMPDLEKFPDEMKGKKFVDVEAGFDHLIAVAEDGSVYGWGNNRLKQARIPREVSHLKNFRQVGASFQFSIFLDKNGNTHLTGNAMNVDYTDYHDYQGHIKKVALSTNTVMALTEEGEIVYLGVEPSKSYVRGIPKGKGFTDIVAANRVFAAIDADGKIQVWGNITHRGEDRVPEITKKAVSLSAGQYHFNAILEDGTTISWGDTALRQLLPEGLENVEKIYAGYYQNYVVTKDGEVHTYGMKGYLAGSDEFGRDVFLRLMNGGRMTLTIGSVAVIISTLIGTILGGISGFFGGRVDMLLQRFGEVVNSMPFLPTIIILNSVIGNKMTSNQRIYLIMVLLGLLSWVGLMRLVRAQVLSIREQEFVTAARAMGISEFSIVFRHIIPNVISIIIVSATLNFAGSLLTEASLSFLGFGVQAPQPTWGNMILGATDSTIMSNFWWRWVFPAVILSVCVICINLIGTGLDDAIDPKSQER